MATRWMMFFASCLHVRGTLFHVTRPLSSVCLHHMWCEYTSLHCTEGHLVFRVLKEKCVRTDVVS